MRSRILLSVMVVQALLVPSGAIDAQTVSAEVTIKVPVNLTQLGPDVGKVVVACNIQSSAITNGSPNVNEVNRFTDVPVSGGQVVTTVTLVFSLTQLNNPVGKTAAVLCNLTGWSTSQQAYVQFGPNSPNPSFRTTTNPPDLNSTFVW